MDDRGGGPSRRLLRAWREIGRHFGRDQSKVRRGAAERKLPVYRAGVDGGRGVPVHAYADELDAWLRAEGDGTTLGTAQAGSVSEAGLVAPAGAPLRRWPVWIVAIAVVLMLAAGAASIWSLYGRASGDASRGGERLPESVHALYMNAGYLWPKRTRATLIEAEGLLLQMTELAPRFADAHADLATVYNLMVEYHVKPAEEGYTLSMASAQRAIALDPRHASALTVLGDLSYFWQKDYEASFGYFERAVQASPDNVQARQWYASALMTSGRLNDAEAQILKARELLPEARTIIVSHAMIQLGRGEVETARAALLRLLENEASYRNPYRFLLFAELVRNDMAAYLETMKDWFALIDSPSGTSLAAAAAAEAAWHDGGAEAMIEAMAEAAYRDDIRDTLERYFRAHVRALAGDWDGALDQLQRTPTRQAFYYSIDPAFDEARKDPDFLRAIGELGFPVVPLRGT